MPSRFCRACLAPVLALNLSRPEAPAGAYAEGLLFAAMRPGFRFFLRPGAPLPLGRAQAANRERTLLPALRPN